MTKLSDNLTPSLLLVEQDDTAVVAPAAGNQRLFIDEADQLLYLKDSADSVTAVGGGGGDITTDAAWAAKGDLIVGTANDTAAVLTAGTNDYVLTAASGEATGLKWAAAGGASSASGARVYNDVNIALNNGTLTALTFNQERWDDAAYHDTGTNTGRLTVPAAGRFLVGGHVQTTASPGNPAYVAIRVGGSTFIAVQNIVDQSENYTMIQTVWDCTAGTEYFELLIMANAGSKNALAASAFSPEFWIERLGDT